MSLFGNISMLNAAMRNFQYGLDVTANNLANATTVGYSRQVLNFEALSPVWDGSQQLGSGSRAGNVQRMRDLFLDQQSKLQRAELGRASAHQLALQQLGAIFPELASASATGGLKGAINDLAAAWDALALSPASLALKAAVRDKMEVLAQRLNTDARMVYSLQEDLDTQIGNTISEANLLMGRIRFLNEQIKVGRANTQGVQPNSLLDQREQAAQQLAELIGSQSREVGDGSLVVTFSGGTLVDGNNVFQLKPISSTVDPSRTGVGYYASASGASSDVTNSFKSGKLGGLLQSRDVDVENARLTLDKMAYGFIARANEVNSSYVAGDFTTNHKLFAGSKASDIAVTLDVLNNSDYLGGTRDSLAPGDLAKLQGSLKDFIMFSQIQTAPFSTLGATPINETGTLLTQNFTTVLNPAATAADPGELVIVAGGNATTVQWNNTMTLNEVIRNINAQGGGAFYATFDKTSQKVLIYGQTPLEVYDNKYNLGQALALSSVVVSSAPINNAALTALNQVNGGLPLNSSVNALNVFSQAQPNAGGVMLVDGNPVSWLPTEDPGTILFNIQSATPVNQKVYNFFDSANQVVYLIKSGDVAFNVTLTAGNPLKSIGVQDSTGNLSRVFNFDTDTNSSRLFDAELVELGGRADAEGVLKSQAQALVDQTQQLQDNVSKVDLNAELAQARIFQRSYEASVRLQAILDEVLNVLINHTGTSSGASSAI
jgi:flagellar hook-associated protein FlgK